MCLKIYNTRGMQVPYKSDNMVIAQIYDDNATREEHDLVVDVRPCVKPMLHSLRFLPLFFFFFYLFILPPNLFTMCIYWKNNYRHEKYVTRKPKRNHWAYMN